MPKKCFACDLGDYSEVVKDCEFELPRGDKLTVPGVLVLHCARCGEEAFPPESLKKIDEAIEAHKAGNPEAHVVSLKRTKLVHIYAQQHQHDDCFIVANKEGLRALKKAIDKALEIVEAPIQDARDPATYAAANAEVMTTDGEGYTVKVRLDNSEWTDKSWTTLLLPYTDHETTGIAEAIKDGHEWPHHREPDYRAWKAKGGS